MNWSEQQFADFQAGRPQAKHADVSNVPFAPPPNEAARFALGRLPVGEMNKTEAAYDRHLAAQKHAGEVLWYKFEALKLRLADSTFYTPDFAVLAADGVMECHEVKGFWEQDAKVKIKVAASIYPFRFVAITARAKKIGGGWQRESF